MTNNESYTIHERKARKKLSVYYDESSKVLITLAETLGEALSDFEDYAKNNNFNIVANTFYTLNQLVDKKVLDSSDKVLNIISFDNELPDDNDGWFAIAALD
jgi:hypothetical protein